MRFKFQGQSILTTTLAFVLAALVVVSGSGVAAALTTPSIQRPIPRRARERLEREVGHQLRMLPYYSVFDNLAYRVNGYQIELLGQVTRPTLRSDAEAVVKRIEGVEGVVNNIEVLPVSIEDDRLRRRVYRAIYSHPVLSRYAIEAVPPIHIIVKNGNVTLVGVVATKMEKNVANIQANSVFGVFSVTNKLRVERS
jgi:osmotically-inducible protein OsmY